jgi:hypothetical protein
MFWLAPIIGATIAGVARRALFEPVDAVETVVTEERQAWKRVKETRVKRYPALRGKGPEDAAVAILSP